MHTQAPPIAHPDALIRAAVRNNGQFDAPIIFQVLQHLTTAQFNSRIRVAWDWRDVGMSRRLVGTTNPSTGQTIGPNDPVSSLDFHLIKRFDNGHLQAQATAVDYLNDLREAANVVQQIRATGGQRYNEIHIGEEQGDALLGMTLEILPGSPPHGAFRYIPRDDILIVVYNADRGEFSTGFLINQQEIDEQFEDWDHYEAF